MLLFVVTLSTISMKAQFFTGQKEMAAIAALTATGNTEQLKGGIQAGLDGGLTVNEVKEAMVQLYAYCGFPRSLNAINTLMKVLEERKEKGIADVQGKEASDIPGDGNKYQTGKQTLQQLTGREEQGPMTGANAFAPAIDTFLKEHLFADIFSRDVLNYVQREWVTIAALAALPGVEPQLQAHLNMGRHVGVADEQLSVLPDIIDKYIGRTQANVLRKNIQQPVLPVVQPDLLVRISEIEILLEYLEEYKHILQEESAQSIKIEPGVIAIFPMFQQAAPEQIRIVEIYAGQEAYHAHLETPHFKYYKAATTKMVVSLKLVDMKVVDKDAMGVIFSKIGHQPG